MNVEPCSQLLFSILIADAVPETVKLELEAINYAYRLVYAVSKHEVDSLLTQSKFDLILLNPDLVNKTVIISVNTPNTTNFNVPVIALAESLTIAEKQMLIATGYDDCILKPLTTENFTDAATLWLSNSDFETIEDAINKLLAKVNNDRALVLTLWEHLLAELPTQKTELEHALNAMDYKIAYDIVHKINGSAKICCLIKIESLAEQIEKSLLTNKYKHLYEDSLNLSTQITALTNQNQRIFDLIING